MGSKRRRSSPWPLIGISLALLLLPTAATQKGRLVVLAGFNPFRWLGRTALPSCASQELRTENDFLKDQVQKLDGEVQRLKLQLDQLSGVKQTLRDPNLKVLHADVIFPTDGSPWRKSLTIGRGSRDSVQKGMLVLHGNHVVGRVIEAGPWSSRVQTVTDPGFRAGAVAVPRSTPAGAAFAQRHGGVYEGTSGQNGRLKWFMGDTSVENGAFVLTTEDPANGIPHGLILGRMATVRSGRGAGPDGEVESILNFRDLERVMILVQGGR